MGSVASICWVGPVALSALKNPDRVESALKSWVETRSWLLVWPVIPRESSNGEIPDAVAPTVVDCPISSTLAVLVGAASAGVIIAAEVNGVTTRIVATTASAARNLVVNLGATISDARRCAWRSRIEVP